MILNNHISILMSFPTTSSVTLSLTHFIVSLIEFHTYWKFFGQLTTEFARVDRQLFNFDHFMRQVIVVASFHMLSRDPTAWYSCP